MADTVIDNPTYMEHVRHFFEDVDLEHMFSRGVDLSTYPQLKAQAARVFQLTRPPNAKMPPEPDRKWSSERHRSFVNWMANDYPLGKPQPHQPQSSEGARVRKDARELSADEIATVKKAFKGIMDLPPDDEGSYFTLAGLHWFPAPSECLHHEDRYHAWHRVLLHRFEDALRAIPGCADVTLPYWDITATPPDFLFAPPFDSYTLPLNIHPNYPAGYKTTRNSADEIMQNVAAYQIPQNIQDAMSQFDWAVFTSGIEGGGHDNGHVAVGGTLSVPDAASFDPLFWFFHSNWDRLWWEWQQIMEATTPWSFRSTIISGFTEFLDLDPINQLPPFSTTAVEPIDLAATGVGYALPGGVGVMAQAPSEVDYKQFGSIAASRSIVMRERPLVSIRLKGIERLAIPGSFRAVLKADGEPVARQAFFQSTEPKACDRCRDKPVVDLDFRVDAEAVMGRHLTTEIEVMAPGAERIGRRFPLHACGDPTLNVRLLLQEAP